jgi:hypothetical protein
MLLLIKTVQCCCGSASASGADSDLALYPYCGFGSSFVGNKINADPDAGQTLPSKNILCVVIGHTVDIRYLRRYKKTSERLEIRFICKF